MVWIPVALRAYAPSIVGWWLAVAGGLRLEQLRADHLARQLAPAVQWGVIAMLLLTSACIVVTSAMLWQGRRCSAGRKGLPAAGLNERA
ncbi:MAG: hypothetical protein RR704_09290 [Stenotrophomonas sp.]